MEGTASGNTARSRPSSGDLPVFSSIFPKSICTPNRNRMTPMGASQTTNIDDMITTVVKVGTGALLSKSSCEAMTAPNLLGFGKKQDNCAPSCGTQTNVYNYGLGVVRSGSWLLQNPLLGGLGAIEAYLPSKKIAIAVAATFAPEAFDSQGNYSNSSDKVFRSIGAYLAPDDAPPPAKD